MYLVNTIEQYDKKYLYFCDSIKNNIMNEGSFIRILYTTDLLTLNGVYVLINLQDINSEKYYNKYKCTFNTIYNKEFIDKIKTIEDDMLIKYKTTKKPIYKIYDQLKLGYIKLFSDVKNIQNNNFILKISGIWETQNNYGLTYKFIKPNFSV
jgi:hypothetical protein